MTIKVIQFDGTKHQIECEDFEFRTNLVTNWVKCKFADGSKQEIRDVCVIKSTKQDGGYKMWKVTYSDGSIDIFKDMIHGSVYVPVNEYKEVVCIERIK